MEERVQRGCEPVEVELAQDERQAIGVQQGRAGHQLEMQVRAAVTSADGQLLGLLCLKSSRTGFCSDQDVRARALGEADPAVVGGAGSD